MFTGSKLGSDIYEDWTPCGYRIKEKEIIIDFAKIDDDQQRLNNLILEELKPEVTNHEIFLNAIFTWTGRRMTLDQWKKYERNKMDNLLSLTLHVSVNNDLISFDLQFFCSYPGQLGLLCSELLKKINNSEIMQDEPDIVCV